MTLLNSIYHTWRAVAEGWRELFEFDPLLEPSCLSDEVEDDPRDAEARERERIEMAILSAHFHP